MRSRSRSQSGGGRRVRDLGGGRLDLAARVGEEIDTDVMLGRLPPRLDGQVDREARSPAGGRRDLDPAVVLVDDAITDAESQARPLADRLGREERIEDPLADRFLDA